MLFGSYKPVGIHLTHEQCIGLALGGNGKSLGKVFAEPTPEGSIIEGQVLREEAVMPVLTKMQKELGAKECIVALPASRVYSQVMRYEDTMDDDLIIGLAEEKAAGLFPIPKQDLFSEVVFLEGQRAEMERLAAEQAKKQKKKGKKVDKKKEAEVAAAQGAMPQASSTKDANGEEVREVQASSEQEAPELAAVNAETEVMRPPLVFGGGAPLSLMASTTRVLQAAGFKEVSFVLDGLALPVVVPVKLKEYPAFMLLHGSMGRVLVSCVFHGRVFNSFWSLDIGRDFAASFQSFYELVDAYPTHIVVSGDTSLLGPALATGLEPAATFVQAEFLAKLDSQNVKSDLLLIAAGAALCGRIFAKNDGARLVNLLN